MATQAPKTYEYQTETKRILDVVIHSLYKNKEIFVRELISNAADSIEKYRHMQLTSKTELPSDNNALEINIDVSEESKSITIMDNGVGMTRDELVGNLGTIAHSGSNDFIKKLEESKGDPTQLIGQFGLGFYSAFMVSENVKFITRSYLPKSEGLIWESDGENNYTISREESIDRGARIVLQLDEKNEEFANVDKIKSIIKEYSNFVSYPIKVNGEQVNAIQAIWAKRSADVEDTEYNEFYKFLTNAYSDPKFRMHITADAPIQMNTLVFVPEENIEKFGFSRTEPGINLYCNKILIESGVKEILPDYFRFVKGVVDSEDLPLNIARETLQDNRIIGKIKKFLTKRIIKFLQSEAKNSPDKYNDFWKEFGNYIKEGVHSDFENKTELAKLLRYETSKSDEGAYKSLGEYVEGMKESQKDIYYIFGESRKEIDHSPYLEMFRSADIEVLYLYDPIDDFVLSSLLEFDGKNIVSSDKADIDLSGKESDKDDKGEKDKKSDGKDITKFVGWLKKNHKDTLSDVKLSTRLVDSPAILVNPDDQMTTHMQKVMQASQSGYSVGNKVLEINPDNNIIKSLVKMWKKDKKDNVLILAVDQLIDNTFLLAGLHVDTRSMVDRINELMGKSISSK